MKYRIHTQNSTVIIKSRLSHNERVNERELSYLSQNPVTGLFRVSYDGKKQLIYEAPCSLSIEKYLKKNRLEESSFWKIMAQIIDTQIAIKGRGLYPEHLAAGQDMIFIREDTQELFFVYQPVISPNSISGNVFAAIQDIIFQEVRKGGGIQQEYLIDFQNYIQRSGYNLAHICEYIKQAAPWNKKKYPLESKNRGHENSRQQTGYAVHSGNDEQYTVLLGSNRQNMQDPVQSIPKRVRLTRVNGNEQTDLSGEVLYLGRSSQNDYCIAGNISIGRRHAVIEKSTDGYYLKDMGSVNGTSVNGRRLQGEDTCKLKNGDRIWLADEEFIFTFI